MKIKFPAGQYYLGDLANLFSKNWLRILEENRYFLESGVYVIDGTDVFIHSLEEAGEYQDSVGRRYPIESLLFAVAPIELSNIDKRLTAGDLQTSEHQHILDVNEEFEINLVSDQYLAIEDFYITFMKDE